MNTLLINFVAYYATQVRAQLTDLSAEVIDDLTDGLEADLMDAMQETRGGEPTSDPTLNDLIERFGQPKSYAHELRTAAGFEPQDQRASKGKAPRVPLYKRLINLVARTGQAFVAVLVKQAWWGGLRDFMILMRPLWWMWRALLVYAVIMNFRGTQAWAWVPQSAAGWFLLSFLGVISVYAGQRSASGKQLKHEPFVVKIVNVVLIIFLAPLTITILDWAGAEAPGSYDAGVNAGWHEGRAVARQDLVTAPDGTEMELEPAMVGLMAEGQPVSNLFVYDAEGNPIPRAQIMDQDGKPVAVSMGQTEINLGTGDVRIWVPNVDDYGRSIGNVFPAVSWALDDNTEYCSSDDGQVWDEIRALQFMLDEDKFVSFQDGSVLGQITGNVVLSKDPVVWGTSFTSTKLSNEDGCVMGVKIPTDLSANAIFPAERIVPLGEVPGASTPEDVTPKDPAHAPKEGKEPSADESVALDPESVVPDEKSSEKPAAKEENKK